MRKNIVAGNWKMNTTLAEGLALAKGLDEALKHRIIERIRERQAENGQTILFTIHNPEELRLFADKIVCLNAKQLSLQPKI